MKKLFRAMFNAKMLRGMADALDRLGVTIVALCLIGSLFTAQMSVLAGLVGILVGSATTLFGIYNKVEADKQEGIK